MSRVLHIDFETFSSADIKKVGLENYVNSPDFDVTVCAWAFDSGPTRFEVWPDSTENLPAPVFAHIRDGGEIRAWNAAFEYAVLTQHFLAPVKPEQMVCTMQKALAYGLPSGLLKAGKALRLDRIKDESKRALMLAMGKPRRDGTRWHETDESRLHALAAYCRDDVEAERAIDKVVPDLHPFERKLSLLDGEINRKGVKLDLTGVNALRAAAGTELLRIDSECTKLTAGCVNSPGTQTMRLMDWLKFEKQPLPDVSKASVAEALEGVLPPHVRRVLELRQQAAKSSVAKLDRMQDVAGEGERARNLLQFYGAGRTGRWAGRLVQPQNLPRVPKDWQAEAVIALAASGGLDSFYPSPMDAISKTLRSCFLAEKDRILVAIDLSQIEARVLAWLAGQGDVLAAFAKGEDVYTLTAKKVGSDDRQLGKVLVLACGYGMGPAKFADTAKGYGIILTEEEAKPYVWGWRDSNPRITAYWGEIERAVAASITHRGYVFHLPHGMAVKADRKVCQIRKPNGVKLTYHNMRFEDGGLVFDGVNSMTKNWGTERTYGGRLTENVVQSIARDVMAEAMLASGDVPVMSVHDEIVWEVGICSYDLRAQRLKEIVERTPEWASGLPIASETHIGRRYAK
jgi:DNA polymerase